MYTNRAISLTALLCWATAYTSSAVTKTDGSYPSGGQTIRVTRYDPAGAGPHPAVLILHGVDGMEGTEATYAAMATSLAENGYVAFVVRYFDCFADRPADLAYFRETIKVHLLTRGLPGRDRAQRAYEDCLATVADGMRHVRTQTGVDGDRIGVVGLSMGGFVATTLATREELKIAAVVELFGGLPEEFPPRGKLPPMLIIHGESDREIPVETAHRLAKLLEEKGSPHEVRIYPGVGHVFLTEKGSLRWDAALDAQMRALGFLQRHLKRAE